MKTFISSLALAVIILASGAIILRSRSSSGPPAELPRDPAITALEREVAALRAGHAALLERVSALEARGPLEKQREERQAAPAKGDAAATPEPGDAELAPDIAADAAARGARVEEALDRLLDPKLGWDERQAIWRKAAQGGFADDLVAAFERVAAENKGSADAQASLGAAYLQRLNLATEFEKAAWANKADRAFDAALALDERHWDARFSKAISLSFWPPIMGKQGEAIRQFEILRKQAEESPVERKQLETYTLLRNLYRNRGETAKAEEVRQAGAARFPDAKELEAESAAGEE